MEITVAAKTIPDWRYGGTAAKLRIYLNQQIVTSNGKLLMPGNEEDNKFYKELACTVAGTNVTIPAFTIDSTTDSSNKLATYAARFFNTTGKIPLDYLLANFKVPITWGAGETVTWDKLVLANRVNVIQILPDYLNTEFQFKTEKGSPNGYVPLNANGKVDAAYLSLPDGALFQLRAERNQPNGYPALDAVGKIAAVHLPVTDMTLFQLRAERNQPNGYLALNASGKADATYVPIGAGLTVTNGLVVATPADSAISFSDTTVNNATTVLHGFLRKLSGVPTEFLNGSGAWAVPPGGTGSTRFDNLEAGATSGQILLHNGTAYVNTPPGTLPTVGLSGFTVTNLVDLFAINGDAVTLHIVARVLATVIRKMPAIGNTTSAWGDITGALTSQLDLVAALAAKVPTTRTVNGYALSGNVTIAPSDLVEDATHRFTTDTEKTLWNAAAAIVGSATADGDAIVNTLAELLAVFSTYPEGVNVATALAGKADTTLSNLSNVATARANLGLGTVRLGFAVSDETTNLAAGAAKITFRMPHALNLTAVRASVTDAPTGANLIIDINESGLSVLSTKLSIDAGEETSVTAFAPAVISDTALADDAKITVDIDQVGSTLAGKGLKIYLIGTI